jgi:hypothetical protein
MSGPNPLRVAVSILRAQRVAKPDRFGTGTVDHSGLEPALGALANGGTRALSEAHGVLGDYLAGLGQIDPADLTRDEALAFWLNLYNAGALRVAARALETGEDSVLRVPGGFDRGFVEVAGERLSLEAIEHGKIRRFRDPRIHAALVCGSVSCPTLRPEPYVGTDVDRQLDDQMRSFLAGGGAVVDEARRAIRLSRVLLWYGGDFTRPHRMPTWLPPRRRMLLRALHRWLPPDLAPQAAHLRVEFQSYDWGLRCAVG